MRWPGRGLETQLLGCGSEELQWYLRKISTEADGKSVDGFKTNKQKTQKTPTNKPTTTQQLPGPEGLPSILTSSHSEAGTVAVGQICPHGSGQHPFNLLLR